MDSGSEMRFIFPCQSQQRLRFYQRRGFLIVAVHINALEEFRKIKPEIPLTGNEGIPLRDEIEFELLL